MSLREGPSLLLAKVPDMIGRIGIFLKVFDPCNAKTSHKIAAIVIVSWQANQKCDVKYIVKKTQNGFGRFRWIHSVVIYFLLGGGGLNLILRPVWA